MNTHRFYKAFACVVAIIIAAQPFVAYAAKASGSDAIKAAQAQATAARSKLNGMSTAVEEASEDYYAAKEKTAATTAKIKKSTAALKQAEAQLVEARAQLNERSASTYRSGELSFLSVLMGSDSFQDFVSRFELMRRIATSDADLVVDVRNARAKIEATKQQLNEQRSAEKTAEAKELKEYKRVQGLLNAQKSYLASLDAQVKDLMAAEQKRAEERERRKAEEERKQREAEEKRR
ncbi:MAG: hypothetical protein LBJ07_01660, partial [Actinomycetes bacterium]|nr:hypothetical protein [Actinomycetes bacterium]